MSKEQQRKAEGVDITKCTPQQLKDLGEAIEKEL